jgi:redox-sensitive bicupin YhaK (pirin superfamily)
MMLEIRDAMERGHTNHGWLDSYHSFSFGDYSDPQHMGFGTLRVINEDRVQPGKGFGAHAHRDMEIISYVLEGALEHKDSMGTGSIIRPGDVQRMSAGSGVTHSEFNPADSEQAHFLQIWITPKITGRRPSYEQKYFSPAQKRGRLVVIASQDGRDGSVTVDQDVVIYAALIDGGERVILDLLPGRRVYLHVARGAVNVNAERLQAGDALKVVGESQIMMEDGHDAEVLLFDLA